MSEKSVWCWKEVDLNKLKDAVRRVTWTDVLSCRDVDKAWTCFRIKLDAIATEHIPRKTIRTNTRPQPWMTGNIIAAIKLKHQLFKAYHRLKSSDIWLKYKQQRTKVCSLVRNAKSLSVTNLELTADGTAKTNDQKTHQSVTNVPRLHKLLKCLLCRDNLLSLM